jgi:hypothetical protein
VSLLANLPDRLPGRILDQRCRRRRVGPGMLSGSHLRGPAHDGRGEAVEHNAIAVCDGDAGADTRIRTRRRRRPARPAAAEVSRAGERVRYRLDGRSGARRVRLGALRPLLVPDPHWTSTPPPTAPPPCSTSRRLTSWRDTALRPGVERRARLPGRPSSLKGRCRDRCATGLRPALDPGVATAPHRAAARAGAAAPARPPHVAQPSNVALTT